MFGVVSEQAFQEAVLIALAQQNRSIYEVALALLSLASQEDGRNTEHILERLPIRS